MDPEIRSLLERMLDEVTKAHPSRQAVYTMAEDLRKHLQADDDRRRLLASCVPAERLDESAEFKAANKRAQRLHMAFDLFRSLMAFDLFRSLVSGVNLYEVIHEATNDKGAR